MALKAQIRERNILVAEAICKRGVSIRTACATLKANRTTVSRRLNGGKSHRQASQENQYLTPAEETAICEIIKKVFPSPISSLGRNTYRKLGQSIVDKTYNGKGPHKHFSESWEHRLRQRHKQLSDFKRNKKLYSALNVEVFEKEFDRLRQVVYEYNISPDNFYSVGELSFYTNQMGIDSVGIGPEFREGFMDVFYDEAKTEVVYNPPVHAIAFECCSAACQILPTFVAFQKNVDPGLFYGETMVMSADMSADNDGAFLEWLKLFDKHTRSTADDPPFRLIYFAAHFFNLSIDVLEFAVKNNILFYASPPERSHMQPIYSMLEVMASHFADNTFANNVELLQSIDNSNVLDVFESSTSSDSRLSTPPSSDDYQYTDPTLSSEFSDDILKQDTNGSKESFTPEYIYDDFLLFPLKF
ncbi:hypothetical protein D0Z00_002608 [Geotrichum galactomycetum]|uniref:Uncharacterized protein n=1 Tax=Geotrichum galactomycetum TaxID=27317 RepID=A0ACB6V3J3_9ASCO|nr:hypothetical protein D0Z00_002608 [Geotrichum candidum]